MGPRRGAAPVQEQQQQQLRFSRDAPPPLPENWAACYSPPRPIVIEKLKAPEGPGAGDGPAPSRGSVEFSAVSQEKLDLAVQLARRDMKRRRLREEVREQRGRPKEPGSGVARPRAAESRLRHKRQLGERSGVETTSSGAKVYLCTPGRAETQPFSSDSPPTHDPGPHPGLKRESERNTLEVRRLQKELQGYVQKIEELGKKERSKEVLDPDQECRVRVRRQEQTVRSTRMLYVLQQQVREIQEELQKLSPHKIKHTKKSRAVARLAAAHRAAIRALQAFVAHFADQPDQEPAPAHCKELGNLIRQLSLCSARLEMDSSVPEVVIDLLLQIEDLETLLSKKESPKKGKNSHSTSQAEPPTGRRERKVGRPPNAPVARRLLPDECQESGENLALHEGSGHLDATPLQDVPLLDQEAALPAQQESLGRPGPVKTEPGLQNGPLRKRGVLSSARAQGSCRPPRARGAQAKQARFRESTVSFRLKETKPPVKESSRGPPWVPPSSPHRVPCKQTDRGPRNRVPIPEREGAGEDGRGVPGKEPLSGAGGTSPSQIAEKVERAVWERLEPLLAKAQKVNLSLERNVGLKEHFWDSQLPPQDAGEATAAAVSGNSLEDSAWEQDRKAEPAAASAPDLETMLQRMVEIERSQEAVRRRYNQIVYSDPEFWVQEESKERASAAGSHEPLTPHPIHITKPGSCKEPQVDIVLGRPLDANAVEEETEMEERPEPRSQPRHLPPQKQAGAFLSLPKSTVRSIRDYSARYGQHLKCISHEAVGSFNPWHIAQSLAEELVEEALEDVAAELQGLCEDYAEAVFTSEFLQAAE